MKLIDLLESNIVDIDSFKAKRLAAQQAKQQKDQDDSPPLWTIHDILNLEPAEDELGELTYFFKKAIKGFKGEPTVMNQAIKMYQHAETWYENALDDENFEVADKAMDRMVKAIKMLGGDTSAFED